MQAVGEVQGDWQVSGQSQVMKIALGLAGQAFLPRFRNLEVTSLLFYTLRKRRLALLDGFQARTSDVLGGLEDLRHQDKKKIWCKRGGPPWTIKIGFGHLSAQWPKGKKELCVFTPSFVQTHFKCMSVTMPRGHAKSVCEKVGALKNKKDRLGKGETKTLSFQDWWGAGIYIFLIKKKLGLAGVAQWVEH